MLEIILFFCNICIILYIFIVSFNLNRQFAKIEKKDLWYLHSYNSFSKKDWYKEVVKDQEDPKFKTFMNLREEKQKRIKYLAVIFILNFLIMFFL